MKSFLDTILQPRSVCYARSCLTIEGWLDGLPCGLKPPNILICQSYWICTQCFFKKKTSINQHFGDLRTAPSNYCRMHAAPTLQHWQTDSKYKVKTTATTTHIKLSLQLRRGGLYSHSECSDASEFLTHRLLEGRETDDGPGVRLPDHVQGQRVHEPKFSCDETFMPKWVNEMFCSPLILCMHLWLVYQSRVHTGPSGQKSFFLSIILHTSTHYCGTHWGCSRANLGAFVAKLVWFIGGRRSTF